MLAALLSACALQLAPAASAAPARAAGSGEPVEVERRLSAMGTWLDVRVRAADRRAALAASERAVRAIEACEARLSTWTDRSELARLNRAPLGEARELSAELAGELARAGELWRATGGAFDPGLGALVAAWGLRSGGRVPGACEVAAALADGGFAAFELRGRVARRLRPLATIEEGGFGKGAGLDAALAELAAAGAHEAVLDLGGQLAVLGRAHATPLADPRDRERPVLELEVAPGSLSTSGNGERGIVVGGARRGHLLDPRSGQPAPDFGSVSVWAREALGADALSTALYVLGPDEALRWCAANPGIELVLLLPDAESGRVVALATEGWRGRARPLVPDLELRFVGAGSDPVPPARSNASR